MKKQYNIETCSAALCVKSQRISAVKLFFTAEFAKDALRTAKAHQEKVTNDNLMTREAQITPKANYARSAFDARSANYAQSAPKILIRANQSGWRIFLNFINMKNLFFSAMTPEELVACKTKLTELEALLPENPTLTGLDRQRLSKISYSGPSFVRDAISLSKDIPELKSSFVDVDQMEGTLSFHQQMNELLTTVGAVQHWLDDLQMVSGSSVDDMARACYKNIKTAADHNVVSAVLAYDRLKGRYVRKRSGSPVSVNGDAASENGGN